MDKMDKNFFRYTLSLLIVAIVFIIIGGISVSRVRNYPKEGQKQPAVSQEQRIEDLEEEVVELKHKLSRVKSALESGTDSEKINKIYDITKEF